MSGTLAKGPAAYDQLVLRCLAPQDHLCEISPPNDERRARHFQHRQQHLSLWQQILAGSWVDDPQGSRVPLLLLTFIGTQQLLQM